ncbi:AEC family transporter [Niallia oryzisoli]|uniref:AEC family transporter n=1 Tax=Niallia oryzisoli TaxID=1737571 RepID=A0ABZ2CGH6_9BACI
MDYSILIFTVLKLAVLIGIGMWLATKIALTKDVKGFLIFVIINIALPAIILSGFFKVEIDNSLLHQIVIIFIFSLCFNILALFAGWAFSKSIGLEALKARETAFLSTFGNSGPIGIPLCASLFGAKGAVYAAVFDAGMSLTLWTIGTLFVQGKTKVTVKNFKSMITAPNIAVTIGMIFTFFRIDPGSFVKDVTSSLGAVASPLAMIYIGMLVMTIIKEKRTVPAKLVAIPVSFKLIVFPVIGILALTLLPIAADVEQVLLIEMAMPAVTVASVILALYNADENYGVMHTLLSNLIVLVSLPVIVLLGGMLL